MVRRRRSILAGFPFVGGVAQAFRRRLAWRRSSAALNALQSVPCVVARLCSRCDQKSIQSGVCALLSRRTLLAMCCKTRRQSNSVEQSAGG